MQEIAVRNVAGQSRAIGRAAAVSRGQWWGAGPTVHTSTAECGMTGGALRGPQLRQRPAPTSAVTGAASTRGPADSTSTQIGMAERGLAGGTLRGPQLRQRPAPTLAGTGAASTRGPAGSTSTQVGMAERGLASSASRQLRQRPAPTPAVTGAAAVPRGQWWGARPTVHTSTAERGLAGSASRRWQLRQHPAPTSAVTGAASTRAPAGSTSTQIGMAERCMAGGASRGPRLRQYPAPTLAVTGAAATRGRIGNATPTGRSKAGGALDGPRLQQRLGPALSVTGAAATRRQRARRLSGAGSAPSVEPSVARARADVASLPRRRKVAPPPHARADKMPRRRYTLAVFTLTVPKAGRPCRRGGAGHPGQAIARAARATE